MSTLWEKLTGIASRRAMDRVSAYAELVKELADGKRPDPERILDVCEAAGKSPDDLRVEVEATQKRRQDLARVQRLPAVRKDLAQIASAIQAADVRRVALIEKIDAECNVLFARQRELLAEEQILQRLANQLEQTAPDHLLEQVNAAELAVGELMRQRLELDRQVRFAGDRRMALERAVVEAKERERRTAPREDLKADAAAEARAARDALKQFDDESSAFEKAIGDIDRQVVRAREAVEAARARLLSL
jgi:hypothetical protein